MYSHLRRVALAATCLVVPSLHAAELTSMELRWLKGVRPVVEQARAMRMPLDIVVQPQAARGLAPLALAFVGGRCKLVLSLRDNPAAVAQVSRIAAELGAGDALLDAALALMAAHEVFGHCARHVAGQWHATPHGYTDPVPEALDARLHADYAQMRAARREEGYADLAALAWAREALPELAGRLHAWLLAERSGDLVEGSHHDTLGWIRTPRAGTVDAAWRAGLISEMQAAEARATRTAQR